LSNVAFWITLGGILTIALLAYRSAKKAQAEAIVRKRTSPSSEATTPGSPDTPPAKANELDN
jgi:Flp pilus assembly protein protease CpaA